MKQIALFTLSSITVNFAGCGDKASTSDSKTA